MGIHSTLELVALAIIGVELVLKLRWIGWMAVFKHKRTMIKVVASNGVYLISLKEKGYNRIALLQLVT